MTHWTEWLMRRNACYEAIRWAKQFDDPNEAWKSCPEPEWQTWLLDQLDYARICRAVARSEEERDNVDRSICNYNHVTAEDLARELPEFPL